MRIQNRKIGEGSAITTVLEELGRRVSYVRVTREHERNLRVVICGPSKAVERVTRAVLETILRCGCYEKRREVIEYEMDR